MRLLRRFETTGALFSANTDVLIALLTDEHAAIDQLLMVRSTLTQALKSRICNRPLLSDEIALVEYLTFELAYAEVERFRVLFLNARNCLLRDEIVATGSVRSLAVHPREIVRRAIELSAAAIIVVHNHPSGDPTPSAVDIETTRHLQAAARLMGIELHDHLIVAQSGYCSLKKLGVL